MTLLLVAEPGRSFVGLLVDMLSSWKVLLLSSTYRCPVAYFPSKVTLSLKCFSRIAMAVNVLERSLRKHHCGSVVSWKQLVVLKI